MPSLRDGYLRDIAHKQTMRLARKAGKSKRVSVPPSGVAPRLVNGFLIGPGADLEGADLEGADLEGANLYGVNLRGAIMPGWERGPDGYARRIV